jgi:hypothetical protein
MFLKAVLDLDPETEDPAKADLNPDINIYKKFLPRGSVSDPDSTRPVDPDPASESGSRYRRATMTHKNRKSFKFHVSKCWIFSFEG